MQVQLRRGLPRTPGGEPWPPAGTVEVAADPVPLAGVAEAAPAADAATGTVAAGTAATVDVPLRRGLPRTPGGEPFPPAGTVRVAASVAVEVPAAAAARAAAAEAATPAAGTVEVALRRGLPRTPGGEPFPPAGTVRVAAPVAVAKTAPAPQPERTAQPTRAAKPAPQPAPAQKRGRVEPEVVDTQRRWVPWAIGALVVLVAAILGARWYVGTDSGADFIARYDGAQPLPDDAPVGLPAWLNWAHAFNMFLMALIVKTGLDVRREKRPEAYWTPTKGGKKISVTLWLHNVLDVAWVVLGAVFYVLLFTTGQWVRIVPTSWDVFPNAVSAGLQYLSLDWPTEHPWVFYNALQELAYFVTVFVAAPLAILSGWRMSGMWPKSWAKPPVAWARAVHFPTMVYFLAFVAVHVFLVLTTGLRGNFNAMFAARDDATGWTGILLFLVAAGVTALGWWAARASVVMPLAQATGKVSKR